MNTIREAWQSYALAVLPIDCSQVQRQETRRAFYAGVQAMMSLMGTISDEVPDDEAYARMEAWNAEIKGFNEKVLAGRA